MNKDFAKFLNVLSIPINGIFAFINLSEFYIVAIKKDIADYPFGGNGPTPYYYKTAELYSLVFGSYGTIFLLLCFLGIWNIRMKKINGGIMILITLGMLSFQIFQGMAE